MEGFRLFSMKWGSKKNINEQKLAIGELIARIGDQDVFLLQDFPWATSQGEGMRTI